MSGREEVLGRIRAALAGQPGPAAAPEAPADRADRADRAAGYRSGTDLTAAGLIGLLADRLADYGCAARQCPVQDLTDAVLAALAGRGLRRVVLPPGLDLPGLDPSRLAEAARAAGIDLVPDGGFSTADLAGFDGVLTTAALAIAETGTIVLDGSAGQGRRALSLVPDYHLCVLAADRIVGIVPEALALLSPDRPLTWISGSSATSDIELDRVSGVHGPRPLDVIIVTGR